MKQNHHLSLEWFITIYFYRASPVHCASSATFIDFLTTIRPIHVETTFMNFKARQVREPPCFLGMIHFRRTGNFLCHNYSHHPSSNRQLNKWLIIQSRKKHLYNTIPDNGTFQSNTPKRGTSGRYFFWFFVLLYFLSRFFGLNWE